MSPIRPSQVKLLLINPDDEPCVMWKKILHAVYLYYLLVRYENGDDGGIGEELASDLCEDITCPGVVA